MALRITQGIFDDTVRENMNDFGMPVEEAIQETIDQLEAQGVDLSGIVTDWIISSAVSSPVFSAAITKLDSMCKDPPPDFEPFIAQLTIIRKECDKGLNYQVLAGKEGAYNIVLKVMSKLELNKDVVKECLQALISLMTKNADLLDDEGVRAIINLLDNQKDEEVLKLSLLWTRECCTLHEMNRQHIFDADILEHVKNLLGRSDAALLREALGVLRALVLDDDVRVQHGRAHEHARAIANDNTLCEITALLEKFKGDAGVINDVILTLSALLVRTEFCKQVKDAGAIEIIRETVNNFKDNDKILRQCFKVLKAIAGNDECKKHIVQTGIATDMAAVMEQHQKIPTTAAAGLACVAALSLRSADNSKALFDAGFADLILQIMRLHPDNKNVQKNGSWAIRNMVSRSRYQCKTFLELGAEDVLKAAMKKFNQSECDIKAALRDLGCAVKLKEEWTGKGGQITTQEKKQDQTSNKPQDKALDTTQDTIPDTTRDRTQDRTEDKRQ